MAAQYWPVPTLPTACPPRLSEAATSPSTPVAASPVPPSTLTRTPVTRDKGGRWVIGCWLNQGHRCASVQATCLLLVVARCSGCSGWRIGKGRGAPSLSWPCIAGQAVCEAILLLAALVPYPHPPSAPFRAVPAVLLRDKVLKVAQRSRPRVATPPCELEREKGGLKPEFNVRSMVNH